MQIRIVVLILSALNSWFGCVGGSMLWFEEAPNLDDPCTTAVVSTTHHRWTDIHPPITCHRGFVVWYASFGMVRVWFSPRNGSVQSTSGSTKVEEFEMCLVGGSAARVNVWWGRDEDTWAPITYPQKTDYIPRSDSCRRSKKGSLTLYLGPPKGRLLYMAHIGYNITFLEPEKEEEKEEEAESFWSWLF